MIDWSSDEMHIFGEAQLPHLPGHIWLSTSGTVKKKWVALSKVAFLASAKSVNEHLGLTKADCWLQPLPNHHVGGLSIWARAHLTGSKVVDYPDVTRKKWDAVHFYQTLIQEKITATSIVPTQLYDLLKANFKAPLHLRLLLIGGGYLSNHLYKAGQSLGWPAIPTYGCTECCSQIATALPGDPRLRLLPHIHAKLDTTLHVRGPSLFTTFYDGDPKIDGWYDTGDIVELENGILKPIGRGDEQLKIAGEKVHLGSLRQILEEIAQGASVTLKAVPHERLGHEIHLVAEQHLNVDEILQAYNFAVPGYARARSVQFIELIERNAMGKICTGPKV